MSANTSRKLAQQIWSIANDLRGSMDASKFKDYILGVIFYRYLSTHTEQYMNDVLKNDGITYREALSSPDIDPEIAKETRDWALENLGYVIEPDMLFDSLVEQIRNKTFTIETFERAVTQLTGSTIGRKSQLAFENLFDAMDLRDTNLGKEVSDRTALISKVILKIHDTPLASASEAGDVLGTAYMYLIGLFQSNAGKKGGEFFTPTPVSTLLAQLTTIGLTEVTNVSDGCAGSGSLLLEVARHLRHGKVSHYYAQEKISATFNLLRMNLIMHGIDYQRFTVFNDDTLIHDNFYENGKPVLFDIQVENPPYSAQNTASDEAYLDDPRYRAAGCLAPSTKADLAFVESIVYHMADDGRAAILLPHGALFRGGTELEIRKYLIERLNIIDAVIGLPANMFHGTSIPVCVLLLKKNRNGHSGNILFVDAAGCSVKEGKNNTLRACDIKRIVDCVRNRADIPHFSRKVALSGIQENSYNLNIPRYIEAPDTAEPWDVYSLIAGGLPVAEVDALQPYFTAFAGLKEELFERQGHTYGLRGDVQRIVWDNEAVKSYIADYAAAVASLRNSTTHALIDDMDSINADTEDGLVEELFTALEGVPFIDRYDAYQYLNDAWQDILPDSDVIRDEGISAVRAYVSNKVLKKKQKSKELIEVPDGWIGRVIPFELVQEAYLAEELKELKELNASCEAAQTELDEALEALTDEDKQFEFDGNGIWDTDDDKGEDKLNVKGLNAVVKGLKRSYGRLDGFDEDSTEYRIVTLHQARASLSTAKRNRTKALKLIEPKTMSVMDGLSDDECVVLLERKWIDPYINGIAPLARNAVDGLVRKVESLQDKYAVTGMEEANEISALEAELANALGKLHGNETDETGCAMWADFLRGE